MNIALIFGKRRGKSAARNPDWRLKADRILDYLKTSKED